MSWGSDPCRCTWTGRTLNREARATRAKLILGYRPLWYPPPRDTELQGVVHRRDHPESSPALAVTNSRTIISPAAAGAMIASPWIRCRFSPRMWCRTSCSFMCVQRNVPYEQTGAVVCIPDPYGTPVCDRPAAAGCIRAIIQHFFRHCLWMAYFDRLSASPIFHIRNHQPSQTNRPTFWSLFCRCLHV